MPSHDLWVQKEITEQGWGHCPQRLLEGREATLSGSENSAVLTRAFWVYTAPAVKYAPSISPVLESGIWQGAIF